MPADQQDILREQDLPLPVDSFSSKTEQVQGLVNDLVIHYRNVSTSSAEPGVRTLGERDLKAFGDWLEMAHAYFRESSEHDLSLNLASEWVLDNYYIIHQALLQIEEDLPGGYYRQLPKLTAGSLHGLPRIYAIDRAVLSFQNHLLNTMDLQLILEQLQEHVPLSMGELWAVPIFLRYGLIEALVHELTSIIQPQSFPDLPPFIPIQPLPGNLQDEVQILATGSPGSEVIANIILSLRIITEQNWNDFFESVSRIEHILQEDPAGIYRLMDFKTRDMYRKEIEKLSKATGQAENLVANSVLELAQNNHPAEPPAVEPLSGVNWISLIQAVSSHVGEYILGKGRPLLELRIGYHPNTRTSLAHQAVKHSTLLYLGGIISLAILFIFLVSSVLKPWEALGSGSAFQQLTILLLFIAFVPPALIVSGSLVNWLVTLHVKPHILPKLNFTDGIPEAFRTLVVIPAMLTNRRDVDSLVRQVEMNHLRNPEQGLLFALLTDFADTDSQTLPEDESIVSYAASEIRKLNHKYCPAAPDPDPDVSDTEATIKDAITLKTVESPPEPRQAESPLFYLLHRRRLWNPSEGVWMGWERKRGKLQELNLLLRGRQDTSFITLTQAEPGWQLLQTVRYVITLDADTILPRGAAQRLVGTLAHPLNRAVFDDSIGKVTAGYTILQPRMEIHPRSANYSWFTRIFAGDTGLDLYTRAVSDAYQDLFGEGSYVGKGIYDVDAFSRSVEGRIPENRVLSHDLLEGIMGRAGLVTDITLVEDYPPNYYVQAKRNQRWMRGDWQLLPWLIRPGRFKVKFKPLDRWKMFDNLQRSLLAPSLMLVFTLGMIFFPTLTGLWIAIPLLSLAVPLLASLTRSASRLLGGDRIVASIRPLKSSLLRWVLAVAFLPYDAYNALDAILTTLYRLTISRRNLLQWTTAAQTAHLFGLQAYRTTTWLRMVASTLLALILAVGIQAGYWIAGYTGFAPSLIIAAPLILLWVVSPLIDRWISEPIKPTIEPLDEDQVSLFRQVARRTWGFFERFVGPEDHWLPPDHVQEQPVGIIAHHTSPSNIGLFFTSTLAAYDLGYLDQRGLASRLSLTMDTLNQLERFRGHFLNWYDTLTLQPLTPRYISTVDSGNLAACLIITAQACRRMPRERIFRWSLWQGYLDTLASMTSIFKGRQKPASTTLTSQIEGMVAQMQSEILAVRGEPFKWYALFLSVTRHFWPDLSGCLIELLKSGDSALDLEALRKLQEVSSQVERQHQAIQRTLSELVPWIQFLEQPPPILSAAPFQGKVDELRRNLPYNPRLGDIVSHLNAAQAGIAALRHLLKDRTIPAHDPGFIRAGLDWLEALEGAIAQAGANSIGLMEIYVDCADQAERLVAEMDFRFLYHPQRRVFHNGFNLDTGQLDNNYYDILASEARIASIIALAKGEVPQSHWLQLSRPLTQVDDRFVLLSWSATMFEYLMPPLFLRSYPGTLLSDSAQGAVMQQIAYAKTRGVPWGISESGFYLFDANQNYQYRAFGIPGLGFKRGLADDLVVAPYASLMAIGYDPQAVANNLESLLKQGCFGLYGLYESIDFTLSRLPAGNQSAVVHEYMSHHQGMILMSLANHFYADIMVRRMHSDPRIQSVELLLQEQIPQDVPLQNPHAEEVRGLARLTDLPAKIDPWSVPLQTTIPVVTLLSNGSYRVLLSNMGGGYSTWRDTDLTRWQADGVLDPWGSWVYIYELPQVDDVGSFGACLWSAGYQPIPGKAENVQVTFFPHMAVFRRTENDITSTMEITVCPDDPVEIRRIHLHNASEQPRRLRLTSYGEVILTQQATDRRHPAFNKLFIQTEFIPELNLQVFSRRPRSGEEKPVFMGHMLVVQSQEIPGGQGTTWHEADRGNFIGRGRTLQDPQALDGEHYLTGSTGATLDPIFALGQEIHLDVHTNSGLAFLTFAGTSREEILALAARYSSWAMIDRSFHQANMTAQAWLGKQNYDTASFIHTLQVTSALLYPYRPARVASGIAATNHLSQAGLWRFGISGDYPILLVEVEHPRHIDLVREVLQVHEFLHTRRFTADVVILNHQRSNYGAEMNALLYRLVNHLNSEVWLAKRGGIFILYADQITPEERTLLHTAAGFIFNGEHGSLANQIPDLTTLPTYLPDLTPTRSATEVIAAEPNEPLTPTGPLQYFNGYGGFSPDGREYVIDLPPGRHTPAPWINIIGYPYSGFMVSESGSQCSWAINSGENRLTPWSNDPLRDPSGEILYLRDEETGEVWSPTPLPAGADQPYRIRHAAGYTTFEHNSHGLRQRLTLFASPVDPVKIIHLRVENTWNRNRRITATQYVEWVLGNTHAASLPYLVPEYDPAELCLLVTNPYSMEFGERTAFLLASKPVHGLTTDRSEFLGRGGTLASPAALRRIGLGTNLAPSVDLCSALQLHIDLLPGGVEEVYFVLGQGDSRKHALELAEKYHKPANVTDALDRTRLFWDHLLGMLQVRTPEPATDLILNRWMLYQALSCRIWGRSAFYQPSGAFGFRDQLQDILAVLEIDPAIARSQILYAAQFQFSQGDVMHWWHPPSGRGVRTRISDDLLWLPYVTALYVDITGDADILHEKIPFLSAPILEQDENERYDLFPPTRDKETLFEHCRRAIEKGATTGLHGLPLIGTGDWNDAFNRVGEGGLGESVWLGWFLCDVLKRFARLCERQGEAELAEDCRHRLQEYAAAIESTSWDGAWYRRAFYDDGLPLGSSQADECRIDAIAQSWSVISGVGDPGRGHQAMQSVLEHLVQPENRLSLLFTPPFNQTRRDPGYIKGYLPGIRENGGQYSHAAIWTAWAFTLLGDGRQAGALFDLLNPILQADTPTRAEEYRVEPYVISGDIYSQPPHVRRGGWTWYTGSAAWMFRLGFNALLGFRKTGSSLRIEPCIPPNWDGYEITYKYRSATYNILVSNPEHVSNHVRSVRLDGRALKGHTIPLRDDGKEHTVRVVMGD